MIHSLKLAIAKLICAPWIGWCIRFLLGNKIRSRGVRVATNSRWVGSKSVAMLFWNLYESGEARLLKKHLPSNCPVIELGASLGFMASLIGKKLDPGLVGVSIEANPNLVPVIESTLKLNELGNIQVRNLAIDYSGKEKVFFNVNEDNLVSQLSTESNGKLVSATTLENLLRELQWGHFSLVSDIEGAEIGFLLNEGEALKKCVTMIIELHATHFGAKKYDVNDLISLLRQQHGFDMVQRDGNVVVFKRQVDDQIFHQSPHLEG